MFLDRVIHFGENLGDLVKGHSPKKLKEIIYVPYVAHLKVQVLNFNVILIPSSCRVPNPSYPFRGKFGSSGKGSFTEKAKIINSCSLCCAPESTGSKLLCDPYLISVVCSKTELSISEIIWEIG